MSAEAIVTRTAPHSEPHRSGKPTRLGSEVVTPSFVGGVRVRVIPQYLPEHSDPSSTRWVFAYRIRVTNESDRELKLVSRRWVIIDADGDRKIVQGLGVVGEQPVLPPGHSYEYSSGCELSTPWGTMEGEYSMQTTADDRPIERVRVQVGRFFLAAESSFQ